MYKIKTNITQHNLMTFSLFMFCIFIFWNSNCAAVKTGCRRTTFDKNRERVNKFSLNGEIAESEPHIV